MVGCWCALMNRRPLISFLFFCHLLAIAACREGVEFALETNPHSPYYWVSGEIDGRSVRFIVDTGSSMPVISESLASELGVSVNQSDESVRLGHEFPVVRLDNVTIGRLRLPQQSPFQIRNTDYLEIISGATVDGIIGGGVLNAARYEIRFPSKLVRFGNMSVDSSTMKDLDIRDQYLFGESYINGESVEFLIDSGSTFSEIREIDALTIVPNLNELESRTLNIARIGGHSEEVRQMLVADSLQFGGSTLENVVLYVGNQNILGLNVLSKGTLTVVPDLRQFKFELSNSHTQEGLENSK